MALLDHLLCGPNNWPCHAAGDHQCANQPSTLHGSTILQTIGLSPLQLAAIGLLSRVLESINKTRHTLVNTKVLKFVELLITVALILGIVGGIDASDNLETTGVYKLGTKSKVATALFVVSYVAIVIITIITSFSISHAEPGEKRILLAVAISLPFLLIRLVYSIMSGLAGDKHFNLITGSVTILLCVALIEEFIVVVIYESVGLTLRQVPKNQHVQGYAHEAQPLPGTPSSGAQYRQQPVQGNRALRIAKKTIIGRIVMAFIQRVATVMLKCINKITSRNEGGKVVEHCDG